MTNEPSTTNLPDFFSNQQPLEKPINNSASVKIMLSHDYCHFEVSKSISVNEGASLTDEQIDATRKECTRLAEKAVRQYAIAKEAEEFKSRLENNRKSLEREVEYIRKKPEGEWSPRDKARVKALEDKEWWESRAHREYDYEDENNYDWEDYDYPYPESEDDLKW